MTTECKTGVGRIVWGHPSKLVQKRDPVTKLPVNKPDGSPAMQCAMGVAFPKAEFGAMIWPAMGGEIATAYPQGAPQKFSYKYVDGDSVDGEGKPYSAREGYAGCHVLTITSNTGFSPSVFKFNPASRQYDAVPVEGIKCGDYVVCALQFQVNVPTVKTHTPSIYVNPQAIELVGYGTEIVSSGVDPMTAFGGQTYQLPPGASATPISSAPAGVGMPGMPQQPMQQPGYPPQQPMQPAPQYQPQPGYAPPPAPVGYPPQQPGYAPPPAPVGYPPQQPAPVYQPQPGVLPPPAHDFVQPGGMPQQPMQQPQPGYAPPPAAPYSPQQPMQAPPGYPQQPQPGYAPQPSQMPGMPLPR